MGNKHSTVAGSVYQAAAESTTADADDAANAEVLMRRCESHQSVFSDENQFHAHNATDELLIMESLSVKSGASSPTRTPRRLHQSFEGFRAPVVLAAAPQSVPCHSSQSKGNANAQLAFAPKAMPLVPVHSTLCEAVVPCVQEGLSSVTTPAGTPSHEKRGTSNKEVLNDLEEFDLT